MFGHADAIQHYVYNIQESYFLLHINREVDGNSFQYNIDFSGEYRTIIV